MSDETDRDQDAFRAVLGEIGELREQLARANNAVSEANRKLEIAEAARVQLSATLRDISWKGCDFGGCEACYLKGKLAAEIEAHASTKAELERVKSERAWPTPEDRQG